MLSVRHLATEELKLIRDIDRSEEVGVGCAVEDGELVSYAVNWVIPNWSPSGAGEHSVQHEIDTWRPVLERGGMLLGAFDGEEVVGLAVLDPTFEPGIGWLAFLHVGRPHRRRGVGTALWVEVERIAAASGANTIHVSATPSQSAIGFYLGKGFVVASTPHPDLHAREPEDIHLTRSI